jgi:aminotransferase in exopolysaccharide biosynthesis
MFEDFVSFVRNLYQTDGFVPLHAPVFLGNEKEYLLETIDSTFVSSVGEYVELFEQRIASTTNTGYAVATVNGTAALHAALLVVGVSNGDDVLTQALTFVATCNAIRYCGADPVFVDIDRNSLGMSPESLANYLDEHVEKRDGYAWNKSTGRRISACIPMHTFGHPTKIDLIIDICSQYHIPVIEDAAESLGSTWKTGHTGTFGRLGILSFNGNKIITTGGGGMILTNDESLANRARHLTTTARISHRWDYEHDRVGYNYRMPNLNAALGMAQLEQLREFVDNKREVARNYISWCRDKNLEILIEPEGARSNYWLNALILRDSDERDSFLQETNQNDVMTRPAWNPMHHLPMYEKCHAGPLDNTDWAIDRVVNIPSSVCTCLSK